jgi:hypothetical protein
MTHIPLARCDQTDVMLLSHASDPENPIRQTRHLRGLLFRPGDINLDGRVDTGDYFELIETIYGGHFCE